ncbi:MAG: hypothetical protein RI990_1870, partial [Planctomycetota bacterium]
MTPADFAFANPEAIRWAWVVLAIAILVVVRERGRRRALERFAESPLLASIAPRSGGWRPALRATLAVAALALLVPALMDPRWGAQVEEV